MQGECWHIEDYYREPEKVEVISETAGSYVLAGERGWKGGVNRRMKSAFRLFQTWDEAKAAIIADREKDLERAKEATDRARSRLEEAKALKRKP